jgi:hypothetical protein
MKAKEPEDATDRVVGIVNGIFTELKKDGIDPTDAAVSARIVSWLGAHGDELDKDELKELIGVGIDYASAAFQDAVDSDEAPETYAEVANPQKFWTSFKKKCSVKDYGVARGPLMTLRDLLKRRDEA